MCMQIGRGVRRGACMDMRARETCASKANVQRHAYRHAHRHVHGHVCGHVYVHVYGRLWMDMCIYMRIDMCIDMYIEQGEVHRHVRARVCVPSAGLPRAYA